MGHGGKAKKLPFDLVRNRKLWLAQLGLANKSLPEIAGDLMLLSPEASCSGRWGVSVWLGGRASLPITVTLRPESRMQQHIPQSLRSILSLTADPGPKVSDSVAATLPDRGWAACPCMAQGGREEEETG